MATVKVCVDATKVTTSDASGNDISNPENQDRELVTEAMMLDSRGKWLADDEYVDKTASCSVE